MADQTPSTPQHPAMEVVELELMRQPVIARLRPDRRADVARGVLRALESAGHLTTAAPAAGSERHP